jgi:hypothetical protein
MPLQDFYFEIADELENLDLAIDLAFQKLHMGHVGGKLIEHRIERYPVAESDLRPRVIVKSAAQIDDADNGFRRYTGGARQGIE